MPEQGPGGPTGPGAPLKVLDRGFQGGGQAAGAVECILGQRGRQLFTIAWTRLDVSTTGTAVLAENWPRTWL